MPGTVLKIPIARSPEATCFQDRATHSQRQAALVGDLKRPYLSFYTSHGTLQPLELQCKTSFEQIESIRFSPFHTLMPQIAILYQSGLFTFGQGYSIFRLGSPEDYGQISVSFQHCLGYSIGVKKTDPYYILPNNFTTRPSFNNLQNKGDLKIKLSCKMYLSSALKIL